MKLHDGRDSGDLYVGRRAIWRHQPKDGYGFVIRIPVTVVQMSAKTCLVSIDSNQRQVRVSYKSLVLPETMRGVEVCVEAMQRYFYERPGQGSGWFVEAASREEAAKEVQRLDPQARLVD